MGKLRNDLDDADHSWILENSVPNMSEGLVIATVNQHNGITRRLRRVGFLKDEKLFLFDTDAIVWTDEGKEYATMLHSFKKL